MDDHPPDEHLLRNLVTRAHRELTARILPFWATRALDGRDGGFLGRIDAAGRADPAAPKGGILNARILWTFAAATRVLGDARWRAVADRSYAYLTGRLMDPVHGGIYWTVDASGQPADDRKHLYAQAFAVYGLGEYYRATGSAEALAHARAVYELIERCGADGRYGGYREAFGRDWRPRTDTRLSSKDADVPKSMNTHLHLLEAYAGLYRAWPDDGLARRLRDLLGLFLDHIIDAGRGHLRLFFDDDWTSKQETVSYGHDVEASWLLPEAAALVGDAALRARVRAAALGLAASALREGVDADGGLFNERQADGRLDDDKHWWPQAEAVVGFLSAYEETGDAAFLRAAARAWAFIEAHVADPAGAWRGILHRDGTPTAREDMVGPWKCPYHNARACLEVMARAEALKVAAP